MACDLYLNEAVEDVKVVINLYSQKTHSGQDLPMGSSAYFSDFLARLAFQAGPPNLRNSLGVAC